METAISVHGGSEETMVPTSSAELCKLQRVASEQYKEFRSERTPRQDVHERPGKGGKVFSYVTRRYVERWLDSHFVTWSYSIIHESLRVAGQHYHILGRLTVVDKNGIRRIIEGYGACEVRTREGKEETMPYIKAAESDALKRCAAVLGCASDIYDPREDDDIPEVVLGVSGSEFRWILEVALKLLEIGRSPAETYMLLLRFCQSEVDKNAVRSVLSRLKVDI